jgi:putative Mg2+ transporter-C (MgtC) family protein
MLLTLQWTDVGLRLLVAVLAGVLIGWDRGEHGEPTGIRTTLIVCLTATVAMLAGNLLLGTAGKSNGSFAQLDVMRLPLGILTGMASSVPVPS